MKILWSRPPSARLSCHLTSGLAIHSWSLCSFPSGETPSPLGCPPLCPSLGPRGSRGRSLFPGPPGARLLRYRSNHSCSEPGSRPGPPPSRVSIPGPASSSHGATPRLPLAPRRRVLLPGSGSPHCPSPDTLTSVPLSWPPPPGPSSDVSARGSWPCLPSLGTPRTTGVRAHSGLTAPWGWDRSGCAPLSPGAGP